MRTRIVAMFGLIALTIAADAQACNRCGFRGSRCRFSSNVVAVKKVYVAAPQQYQQPAQTITIQNNYNGAALTSPLSAQGQTVYGYQAQTASSYAVSPEAMLNMSARYADHSAELADKSHERFTSLLSLQLSGQQEVAKLYAAAEHLKAATALTATKSTQSITIKTQNGKSEVTTNPPLQPDQPPGDLPPPDPTAPANAPAAFQSCIKCHSGATPKGHFSLDRAFDRDMILNSLARMAGTDPNKQIMPPPDSGIVLSQQEKGEVMQFFLQEYQAIKQSEQPPETPQP